MRRKKKPTPRRRVYEPSEKALHFGRRLEVAIDRQNWDECQAILSQAREAISGPRPDRITLHSWLAELSISVKTTNCLETLGIFRVGQFLARNRKALLAAPNFSERRFDEVVRVLKEAGISADGWACERDLA